MNRTMVLVIGIGLVVVLAVLMAFSITTEGPAEDTEAYGAVTVEGDTLPLPPEGAPDPALGSAAPVVEGVDLAGNPITVAADGQPTVIMFLAHWCPHCQSEVPQVKQWLDATGGVPGVKLLSVATSTDRLRPNFPPNDWLEREGWTVPVLLDDDGDSAGRAFGVNAYPFWVILDPDGNVAARFSGGLGTEGVQNVFESAAALAG